MALRVVGAGLGRTGTASLQLALQQLLDGRCYHMGETFGRPDDIAVWHAAVNGSSPDWNAFLSEYVAAVGTSLLASSFALAADPQAVQLESNNGQPVYLRGTMTAYFADADEKKGDTKKEEKPAGGGPTDPFDPAAPVN